MKALERTVEKLNADLVKNATATKAAGRAAGTATGNIQRMGIAFRTTLGPIVALYGAVNFLNKSLQVASQRQVNVAKLSNGLKNLGGTAADLENLADAADKFGRATLFDQEDATEAFALLTSFQRIGVDSYERVTKAASDLATVTGQDLKGAMTQLSKALEDPARRVTDLARSGTVFTEQQKDQIKALQESGQLFEAQNLILKEIEKQYGGAAEAAGSAGLAGAMDTLGEATRDFQEQLVSGTGAINLAETAIYGLADAIDTATEALRDVQTLITALDLIVRNLNIGLDGLAGVFDIVNDAIIRSIPGLREAIFAYEQLLKLAGQYVDSQAGQRNFGSNYASQEKALFKAAGGFTPYGQSGGRSSGSSSSGSSSSGSSSGADKAVRELERQRKELERQFETGEKIKQNLERELEMLAAGSDLEKERLQIAYDLEDAIAQIIKTAAPAQRDGLIMSAEEVARIKDAQAILEGSNWDEMSQWYSEQSAMTQQLGSEYEQLASGIAGEMTGAFRSIIDGSKSAEEAMADMLQGIANQFLDMAMQIVTDAITQQLVSLFGNLFGGMGGAGGGFGVTPMTSGMSFFADGGMPPVNQVSVVGERGPELFKPTTAGTVVSNEQSRAQLNMYSPGNATDGPQGPMNVNMNYSGPTMAFDDKRYLPIDAVPAIIKDAAKQGEQRALSSMRNKVSTRNRVGI